MDIQTYKKKCIIVGDMAVGKTSLIGCFVDQKFPKDYLPTIGANIYMKMVQLTGDTIIKLSCWDIAGDDKFKMMRKQYYKSAMGAFLVADVTRHETLSSLKEYWLDEVKEFCDDVPLILLVNKDDLDNDVRDGEIESLRGEIGAIKAYRTSAKSGKNVDDAFMVMVRSMMESSSSQ
ncbi:MAG: Rab family GTPase [Candidatus Hodarchaeota archaeon]